MDFWLYGNLAHTGFDIPQYSPVHTGIPKRNIEVGKVTFSKDGDTKFTVTDIDGETGRVSWNVERLPSYEELFTDSTELVDTAKGVRNDTKGDPVFREIYEISKSLRNKIK